MRKEPSTHSTAGFYESDAQVSSSYGAWTVQAESRGNTRQDAFRGSLHTCTAEVGQAPKHRVTGAFGRAQVSRRKETKDRKSKGSKMNRNLPRAPQMGKGFRED